MHVPLRPEETWAHASNLAELGDWMTVHEAWRSDIPEQLAPGVTMEAVFGAKGMRNRVRWTVARVDAGRTLALDGVGKGGTHYTLRFDIAPAGDGSSIGVVLELGGRAFFGPLGSAAARVIRGDMERSLEQFVQRYAPTA